MEQTGTEVKLSQYKQIFHLHNFNNSSEQNNKIETADDPVQTEWEVAEHNGHNDHVDDKSVCDDKVKVQEEPDPPIELRYPKRERKTPVRFIFHSFGMPHAEGEPSDQNAKEEREHKEWPKGLGDRSEESDDEEVVRNG